MFNKLIRGNKQAISITLSVAVSFLFVYAYATSTTTISSTGINTTGNFVTTGDLSALNLSVSGTTTLAATTTINGVNYYWPTLGGSGGQVLATDGNGNLSWATVSGGSAVFGGGPFSAEYFTATDTNATSTMTNLDVSGNLQITNNPTYFSSFSRSLVNNQFNLSNQILVTDKTVALLHMNGTNNSTTFTEATGKTATAYGSAHISTTQQKFGTASGNFNSTTDYVVVNDSPDYDFGVGDFTLEAWVYPNSLSSVYRVISAGLISDGANNLYTFGIGQIWGGGTKLNFALYNGVGYDEIFSNDTPALTTGSWHHVACVRKNGYLTFYVDGTNVGSGSYNFNINGGTGGLWIGARDNSGPAELFDGYIDEVRVVKGQAIYTQNFTPAASEFTIASPVTQSANVISSNDSGINIGNNFGSVNINGGTLNILSNGASTSTLETSTGGLTIYNHLGINASADTNYMLNADYGDWRIAGNGSTNYTVINPQGSGGLNVRASDIIGNTLSEMGNSDSSIWWDVYNNINNTSSHTGLNDDVNNGTFQVRSNLFQNNSGPVVGAKFDFDYSALNTATDGYTALVVNATDAGVGASSTRNLMDLQVGGVSQFLVDSTGHVGVGTTSSLLNFSLNYNAPVGGVNDITVTGGDDGAVGLYYDISIGSTAPDTFNWSDGTLSGTTVPITPGVAVVLSHGVRVAFASNNTHTGTEDWNFVPQKMRLLASNGSSFFSNPFGPMAGFRVNNVGWGDTYLEHINPTGNMDSEVDMGGGDLGFWAYEVNSSLNNHYVGVNFRTGSGSRQIGFEAGPRAPGSGVVAANGTEGTYRFISDYSLLDQPGDGYTGILLDVTDAQVGATGPRNLMDLQVGEVSQFLVDATGNVGIGTTSPSAKLSVVGSGVFSSSVTASSYNVSNPVATSNFGNIAIPNGGYIYYDNQPFAYASTSLYNVFYGIAGNSSMTGNENTAMGYAAFNNNSSGVGNTAMGAEALNNNSTGVGNTAMGAEAAININLGNNNTAIGYQALRTATSSGNNVAVGSYALQYNRGDQNVAIGKGSASLNNYGSYNTSVGQESLKNNVYGSENVAMGMDALVSNEGSYNVAIGSQAGVGMTGGSNNILIGRLVEAPTVTSSNYLNIGNTIFGDMAAGNVGIGTSSPLAALHVFSPLLDNASNTAMILDTANNWTSNTTRLLSVRNGGNQVAQLDNLGGLWVGKNVCKDFWGGDCQSDGTSLMSTRDVSAGDPNFNQIGWESTVDGTYSKYSYFDSYGGDPGSGQYSQMLVGAIDNTVGTYNSFARMESSAFTSSIGLQAFDGANTNTFNVVLPDATNVGNAGINFNLNGNSAMSFAPGITSGTAYYFNTVNNLTGASDRLASFANGGSENAYINYDGSAYFAGTLNVASTTATSTFSGNLHILGDLYAKNTFLGDLNFANAFRFVEDPMPTNGQLATGTQSLILKNQKGENILTIDEFGNLTIPGVINSQSSATSTQPSAISLSIDWILEQFKNVVVTAKEFVAEKITGKQVCVEDVCVNRDQFKELLDKNGIGQSAPAPTPTVAVDVTPADTTATSTENSTTTPADTQAPASTTEPVASGPLPN